MGYMGCGKSALGPLISSQTSLPFIDLDKYIENREKSSISDIFNNNGEIYFRKKERFYLEQIFLKQSPFVISLGGGTPCYFDNIDYLNLKEDAVSIFLKTSPKELVLRLYKDKDHRPMISHLQSKQELEEYVAKHVFERLPFYEKAKITIDTDNKSIETIVEEINLILT
jgi:shikimate kinase